MTIIIYWGGAISKIFPVLLNFLNHLVGSADIKCSPR